MGLSLAECKQKISAREFNLWLAFDRVEPWDRGIAHLISHMYALRTGKKKALTDFMPPDVEGIRKSRDNEARNFLRSVSKKG